MAVNRFGDKGTALETTKVYYNTFVVRIRSDATGTMVGHIRHVHTEDSSYFKRCEDMNAFILKHLKDSPQANRKNS
jgi:hypothetical protein